MTVDNAIKRLLDSDNELSYSQRVAIADLLESLKCCGNCETENLLWGESECPHRLDCNKVFAENVKSFWTPIK